MGTEKAACAAVKGDLSMELTKVGEILGKITMLTGVDAHSRRQGSAPPAPWPRKLKKGGDPITAANVVESTGPEDTAHCRCTNKHAGVSICVSGWGIPSGAQGKGCEACPADGNACNNKEGDCECTCQPKHATTNAMTFDQCTAECANVGMEIPSDERGRASAYSTGCGTNSAKMWIQ